MNTWNCRWKRYAIELMTVLWVAALAAGAKADDPSELVMRNNRFAFQLYGELGADSDSANIFFSPFSISSAFAMAYAGADGQTEEQMARVLNVNGLENVHVQFGELLGNLNERQRQGAYQLLAANSLWGQQGYEFNNSFLKLLEKQYRAELQKVDFKTQREVARAAINSWVEARTNDKIKDIVPKGALDQLTRLVLVNAIYFKSSWMSVFQENATRTQPFFLLSGGQREVPMMQQTHRFPYSETKAAQIIELPYQSGELSMVIVLPKTNNGLTALERELSVADLQSWLGTLRPRRVRAAIPKFKLETDVRLDGILQAMGMTDAFRPGEADFSGMNGKRDLFLQAALHKAFIDVDEEGTEAAAATAIMVGVTSAMPEDPVVFRADHPFFFLIRDRKTGSILFMGRLANPKE